MEAEYYVADGFVKILAKSFAISMVTTAGVLAGCIVVGAVVNRSKNNSLSTPPPVVTD